MPARIMGRRYAERGETAWWGGANRLEGLDGKATTAARQAGVDFPVETAPLRFTWQGKDYVSGNVAILRPPLAEDGETDPVQLGVASREYTPITNMEICQLLDPLTDRWPCETVGSLGRGEDFFITLRAEDMAVAGDEYRTFFFVWNKHDGTGALKVMFTPVRVVCWNTCVMGEQQATTLVSVLHTRQVYAEAEFAVNLVPRLEVARRQAMEQLGQFAQVRVDGLQVKRILEKVYTEKPTTMREELLENVEAGTMAVSDEELGQMLDVAISNEKARERAMRLRLAAWESLQKFNEDRPRMANTAMAVYQSVTEVESWRDGGNDKTLFKSLIAGPRSRTMAAAYDAIVAECLTK